MRISKTRSVICLIMVLISAGVQACCFSCDKEAKIDKSEILSAVKIDTSRGEVDVSVEVAATPEERQRGLMERESLDEGSGMLFVFDDEEQRSFWMKDTLIALDLIFISGNQTIVDIKEDFQPCTADPCEAYQSRAKAMYVLEVNAGFAEEKNIKIGDKVLT